MADSSSDHHFGMAVDIAMQALKALLLVNGGAATALVALTGKGRDVPDYALSVLLFGVAALLNAGTMLVAYLSQLAYANHRLADEQEEVGDAQNKVRQHGIYQRVAFAILALSLVASVAGMVSAFRNVSVVTVTARNAAPHKV